MSSSFAVLSAHRAGPSPSAVRALASRCLPARLFSTRSARARRARAAAVAPRASICGIDLGTTNSAVAVIVDGKPVIVPDEDGRRTTPSVVSFLPDGTVLVGHAARKRLSKDPANTFHSVKRFIGKRYKDKRVVEDARRVPYEVCATVAADADALDIVGLGPRGDGAGFVAARCPALGRKLTPEEISAHVLRRLVHRASHALGEPVHRAVITVPAYFDDQQCDATRRAAERAGLEKVKILHEPVAAALAYGVDVDGDETVFVFDLGGGTFDVSILDVGGGTVEVLATGGDAHLGGDDFDRRVALWLAREAKATGAVVDPRGALMAARRARERLSDATAVDVPMPGGSVKTLTRPLLEKLCADVLRDMRMPVETCSDAAGIHLEALQANSRKKKKRGGGKNAGRPFDQILLVGGATKTPAVRRFVENTFGRKPKPGLVDPDEVVALGAAVHAGALEGLLAETETLGPMQASLIRAFAAKMRAEDERAFEEVVARAEGNDGDDGDEVRDEGEGARTWNASAMVVAAAAANMDLAGDGDDDDDWGPEDLGELEGLTDEEIEAVLEAMERDEGVGEREEDCSR